MRASTPKLLFVSAATPAAQKKGGRSHPLASLGCQRANLRRSRSLFGARLDRPGILALGIHVAIDKLDHADRRAVAMAIASLEHAGVAAVAGGIARTEHVEQLLHHGRIAQLRGRLAARMQVAPLGER